VNRVVADHGHEIGERPRPFRAELKKAKGEQGDQGAVQIWVCNAFSEVPTKVLIRRCYLMALKNNSICQRWWYGRSSTSACLVLMVMIWSRRTPLP